MARITTQRGQVANVFWPERRYWDFGEAGTTDATAWFVIALDQHIATTGDVALAIELWPAAAAAMQWLSYQDATGSNLVNSPAGADWMDSSLKREGRVFHVNVLYWAAARAIDRLAALIGAPTVTHPEPIRTAINGLFWPRPGTHLSALHGFGDVPFPHPLAAGLYADRARGARQHYLAVVSYGRFTDRCDVLAHVLAVAWRLPDAERSRAVMRYLDDLDVQEPFPSRVWDTPFDPADPSGLVDPVADAAQDPRWRNAPFEYHNGGAWPYVGAIHALALAEVGRLADAASLLERVADANALGDWGFHEWIHGESGEPAGAPDQTWNAGAFLWADAVIRERTAS